MKGITTGKGIRRMSAAFLLTAIALACMICVPRPAFADDSGAGESAGPDETVDNGIPVVYLNIDEDQGTIEEMISSPDHSDYCYGTVSIQVPEGFHYVDLPDQACESVEGLAMDIRGRGNSTWTRAGKKSFKIKLDQKAGLFGFKENKHWVLLANYFDETLIKDRITAWLGQQLGFEFTPRGVPVDLVMTGKNYGTKYLGSYYLSENVRVDENRLNLNVPTREDTDQPTISGDYLVQNGSQINPFSPDHFYTSREEWATDTPSFDEDDGGYQNEAQQTYIQGHIQKIEDTLYSKSFVSEDGQSIHDLMDMESAARYWLVNQVSMNHDAYGTGSTYIYKKRDVGGTVSKLYWGPLWDYDFAWDIGDDIDAFSNHESSWTEALLCDREEGGFVPEVYRQWPVMKAALDQLTAAGGVMDQFCAETRISAEADRALYHPTETTFDYEEKVGELKGWISDRSEWLDENIHELDHRMHRVEFNADGDLLRIIFVRDGFSAPGMDEYPAKAGQVFVGWADDEGSIVEQGTAVTEDLTLTAQYIPEEEATHGQDIAFANPAGIWKYTSHSNVYNISYEVIPTDAQYKEVQWSSSDPDYAAVDENGQVTFDDPGDTPRTVTITGKLKYGGSRDFQLTVTKDDLPLPEALRPEQEEVRLKVGEQSPCAVITDPSPALVSDYSYSSDDENVVRIDPNSGVLTAAGAGQTQVHITSVTYDYPRDKVVCRTSVTVIVTEESDGQIARIIPKGTKIKKVKSLKKGFRVKWKKGNSQISGYQLQWRRAGKKSTARTKTIKNRKKLTWRKKGLKGGRVYQVRIRTFKTVDGKRYYSKWSKFKKVRAGK
ncbi:MAG: CotH kinase family protein [Firmicutes bacterium]|nr:CotH kinase family protein [Bacillota bacterium]